MAQVPIVGDIEMFDSPNSIYEVVKTEFATPSARSFSAIIGYVQLNCTIENFHPDHRPATINDVNQTSHFRGFPHTLPSYGTWYVSSKGYVANAGC